MNEVKTLKESDLAKVREEYKKVVKETDRLISYKRELKSLEQDENVKRYLELLELVDRDYEAPSLNEMIAAAYQNADISGMKNQDSNHIMVYVGSYLRDSDMYHDNDTITQDDSKASYKAYLDLETQEAYHIAMDKIEEFEKEYLTIYLPVEGHSQNDYMRKYFELQTWFRKQLMTHSQQEVIEKLQENMDIKYQKLSSVCQNNPVLQLQVGKPAKSVSFDVEHFAATHPEAGFLEEFCLSPENRAKVKQYRKEHSENH